MRSNFVSLLFIRIVSRRVGRKPWANWHTATSLITKTRKMIIEFRLKTEIFDVTMSEWHAAAWIEPYSVRVVHKVAALRLRLRYDAIPDDFQVKWRPSGKFQLSIFVCSCRCRNKFAVGHSMIRTHKHIDGSASGFRPEWVASCFFEPTFRWPFFKQTETHVWRKMAAAWPIWLASATKNRQKIHPQTI